MSTERIEYVEEWQCSNCEEPFSIIARRSRYYGQRPEINGDGNWPCVCTERAMSGADWKLISFAPRKGSNAT